MKLAFRYSCAAIAFLVVAGALSLVQAQTPSSTPDPFVAQITSSTSGAANNPFASFAGDMSANGRFVVIESNGDLATQKTAALNNADGNREIFLFDYAQRRIFQITNTKNVPIVPTSTPTPTPTPTPSASPTPTPGPTPADFTKVQVEIGNNRPIISLAPPLSSGSRLYSIVFSSNAPTPGNFDGSVLTTLATNLTNQEVWVYEFSATEIPDLSTGAEVAFQNLSAGSFFQITNTGASSAPRPGSAGASATSTADDVFPFVADDNRDATISDNGRLIAFVTVRSDDLVHTGDVNGNPEIFLFNRDTGTFTQVTNTPAGTLTSPIFSENPSLSGGTSGVLAFISNANLSAQNDDGGGKGNAEIYLATYTGGSVGVTRQVTKTKNDATGSTINLFSFGRRVSRDGSLLAFESLANDPKANGSINQVYVTFVYNVAADAFTQVGQRSTVSQDILHFPTFTDYTGLTPGSVAFASFLNFRPDGSFPETGKETEGLNSTGAPQIFLAPLPAATAGPFTRLTSIPGGLTVLGVRPFLSETRRRIAFSLGSRELGTGNPDGSTEAYYQLSPRAPSQLAGTISLFTGASQIPVASPSASPTPTPSPATLVVPGLAPGELAIARATVPLAASAASVPTNAASETTRSPALPVELNGVSLSINGAAAGLYAVSATEINFVVPIGLITNLTAGTTSYPIVINIHDEAAGTDKAIRGTLVIVSAQPDIFTTTNGPGGRAIACNITNSLTMGCLGEPFTVTSLDSTGTSVPTVLEFKLTGVRNVGRTAITVRIGTTDITGDNIVFVGPTDLPGFDKLDIKLPASLAGAGDVPVVVLIGTLASSRPADTAPRIQIN